MGRGQFAGSDEIMISAKHLQRDYNKLYKELRRIIWPYSVVEMIANLEIAIYKSFPDMEEVKRCYSTLKRACFRYIKDDEELETAFEKLSETIEDGPDIYSKLDVRHKGVEK